LPYEKGRHVYKSEKEVKVSQAQENKKIIDIYEK
jgi:uncharacterized membrane protein YfhO